MPAKKTKSTKAAVKKTPSPKKRAASTKAKTSKASEAEVTIDRRHKAGRREESEAEATVAPKIERREKVQRRRQIDPTTCERDYSVVEVEFMNAMDDYKRTSGRMFPTCSEVLEVIRSLGYVKLTPSELAVVRPEAEESAAETSIDSNYEGEEELSEGFEPVAVGEELY